MNLVQRTILLLGCNALIAVWLLPAIYHVNADGTRLEANWQWLWEVPLEWSVSVPLTALRLGTVIVVTAALFFALGSSTAKEGAR